MTSKYPAWVCGLAVVMAACAPQAVVPSASPAGTRVLQTSSPGLASVVSARVSLDRHWYTVPDGLASGSVRVSVLFDANPTAGGPYVTVGDVPGGGSRFPLSADSATTWSAAIPLAGLAPGNQVVAVYERIQNPNEPPNASTFTLAASANFLLSQPEYVVWTLDFEGDASGDAELANTAAIADGLSIPMSVFWNPRVWTTSQISTERQDAMLKWTKDRQARADEIALHLHMWTDYVRAAGLVPRTLPSWAGRGDGYDVPMTAYSEAEQKALIDYGLRLMADHGLPKPTSFRAGGDIGDAATLRAVAAAGFTADCTAVAKDSPPIGRVPYPWTLPSGAQPYRPSAADANVAGDLPLLEAPTIGGNTYAYTVQSIQPQIRANLALLAPVGTVSTARKAITVVSHPGTIGPAERAAIEALLGAFGPLRYDTDSGPVRFVTLRDLATAYR